MTNDKVDALKDRATGKAKELEGKVTGDKTRETQGKAENLKGKVKQKLTDAKDDAKELIADAKDKLTD